MLSLTEQGLSQEIDRAIEFRRKHTDKTRQIEERFAGNWFSSDWVTDPTPENAIYSYLAWMLPAVCYSSPQVKVKPRRIISLKEISDSMEVGFEMWLLLKDLVGELQLTCRDMLFGWGVMMVGMENSAVGERAPRLEAPSVMLPFAQHISRHKFLIDPACKKHDDAIMLGHQYTMAKSRMIDNPMFPDQEAVRGLVTGTERGDSDREKVNKDPETGDREPVELIDVWIRDGNRICTLAASGDGNGRRLVRPVTQYQGPPCGPYQVFGCYTVADDPYPMGPVQPVMEQLEEMQAHIRAASDEASSFKNMTFIEAACTDLLNAVKTGMPNGVYAIKGLANNIQQLTTGQLHPARAQHIADLRDRADRVMGIGDNQRGRLADVTASEAQITQANVDLRTEFIRSQFERGVKAVLRKVGHFMFYSPLVVMPVVKQDPWGGGNSEGDFYGGQQAGQENLRWEDFDVSIVPASMGHVDDQIAQARWLQVIALVPQIVQGMMTMPMVNWRYLLDQFGETWNQPNLSDVLLSPAAMAAFGQDPRMFGVGQPMQLPGMGGAPGGAGAGAGATPSLPQLPAFGGAQGNRGKAPGGGKSSSAPMALAG